MRKLYTALLFAMTALFATSCDKESEEPLYIVDWAPINMYIYAEDAEGNDLINEEMEGMTATFKGKTYELSPGKPTRMLLGIMHGLVFQDAKVYSKNPEAHNRLVFGEITGGEEMDEDIVLTWPDGSKNTIHYRCSDVKEGRDPSCKYTWKLDGKEHEGNEFKFVK